MRDLSNENVVHVNKNGVQYIQFKRLLEYEDIITHAYSIGTDINFRTAKVNKEKLTDAEYNIAIKSYQDICNCLGENYINIVKTNQEHTDQVKVVENKINKDSPDINLQEYNKTDGFITDKKEIILSTTNADCILMLFFDPIKKVIGNMHSGWKGTVQRISINIVDKMIKEFECNPKDIICCICPSIRKCHFEVDKDVKEIFEKEFVDLGKDNLNQIIKKQDNKDKWKIDTVLINELILKDAGLIKDNIIDCQICSVCNSDLIHSYRVEKEAYGLSTALISLKK